jgi:hypothetical protein
MSYHIVEITKKTDTLKIMGFEERNPYLYPQNEQIIDFEIIILGVKHYQTNKLYSFSDNTDGKIRTIYYEPPYKSESVREINSFVRELIGSNYGKLQKNLHSIFETKPLRHFIIQDQDSIVDILSDTEPIIRMAKENELGVTDILHKQLSERINETIK